MGRPVLAIVAALVGASACVSHTSAQNSTGTQTALKKPVIQFDQAKAWAHLTKQCDFGPRMPGTKGHKDCRDWIYEQMKLSCDNVRLQPFSHRWSQTGRVIDMWNVIGEQNWKDAKTRIVLLAHWDTRPTADQEIDYKKQKQPILGASDGASGVAVLLELMRATKGKLPKDLGVMYLMVDGEDLGPDLSEMFLGAEYFSKNPGEPKPNYGILLDMVGDKDLEIPMEPNSNYWAAPLLADFYAHCRKVGLGTTFPQSMGPTIEDDHLSLNRRGIPTIDLIDFDYAPWHTLSDTPDKCSAESLGKVGQALETWLLKDPVWEYPKR